MASPPEFVLTPVTQWQRLSVQEEVDQRQEEFAKMTRLCNALDLQSYAGSPWEMARVAQGQRRQKLMDAFETHQLEVKG